MCSPTRLPVIGILHPGEMGARIGRLLLEQGFRVLATGEGRSARTRRVGTEAGLEMLGSFQQVVERSEIAISLVPPAAALPLAAEYARSLSAHAGTKIYIDANSISPLTCSRIAALLQNCNVRFTDGAVHGLASQLPERGTLYLSGPAAAELSSLLGGTLRVRDLGPELGRASLFKMLLGGFSKGMAALFLELSLLARSGGVLDEMLLEYGEFYPALMEMMQRLLPTYPTHARRRGEELQELVQTFHELGRRPGMLSEAQSIIAELGELSWPELPDETASAWTVKQVAEFAHEQDLLQALTPLTTNHFRSPRTF